MSTRASDAEREAVIVRLRDAASEGRLTFEELADRVEAAGSARTREELAELTADLPDPAAPPALATAPAPPPPPADLAKPPVRQSLVFGDARQGGRWLVPARGKWESFFGDVELDLREAQVTAQEIHVEAKTVFGDIDLLVPEGVVVEVRTRVWLGDVKQETAEVGPPGAPRIVLTGGTVFGDVRVRAQRLRERFTDRLLGRRSG